MDHVENRNGVGNRNDTGNTGCESFEIERRTVEQLIVQVLKEQLGPVLKEKTGLGSKGEPLQMPADMRTVEEQAEDVPRDMRCYTDSEGNTYDFAFGMNWKGKIDDERVAKYK